MMGAETRRELAIVGMSCAGCVGRVERALRAVPGVTAADVSLATERAVVQGADPRPSELVAAVLGTGFGAELITGDAARDAERAARAARQDRRDEVIVLASALLTVPLLLPMLGVWVPAGVLWLLATPVQFVAGASLYRNGWAALRRGGGNMDLLVAIGTSAAYGFASLRWLAGMGGPYPFDSAAVVITLVLLGRLLERRTRRAAAASIRDLAALQPERARVERDGREFDLPLSALCPGDVAIVRPGEPMPADGVVIAGASTSDESLLTGESLPVDKAPGDAVLGGAPNGTELLRIRVTATGADSALARIVALVEAAQAGKAPVQRWVDRIAAVFVPVVIACAMAALLGWWIAGQPARGWLAAVSVLVVACPCALGLATPAAIIAGVGAAARAGILVRDPDALDAAGRITLAVFDKTGTLTLGRPELTAIVPVDLPEAELLHWAASAEQGSEHPLGRALVAAATAPLSPLRNFTAYPGGGIRAKLPEATLLIGTARHLQAHAVPEALAAEAARLEAAGNTVLRVARLDPPRLIGLLALRDALRPGAARAVRRLRAAGADAALLTGDNARAAAAVATATGIDIVRSELLPDQKRAEIIRLVQGGQRVAMIGDGLNDAPALAEADLGIAMGGGSAAAIGAAGITLMRADPGLVADVLALGRATRRTIRVNLGWAFGFNLLGLPLAMSGGLDPMFAGGAMAFSSLAVVLNAMRLRRWRPEEPEHER